jgi:hypothetical protein
MRRWLVNPINLVVTLGAVVPFTVLFRWMWFNGRNVPRFDQWRGFPVVYATQDGTLTLADLLRPFGEQMTFFSHLQTAIFTVLTDWNLWAEMWVNLAIGVLAFVLYVVLFARTERRAIVLVLIPFSLLVFMLRQDANWTNGYMSQWWFAQVWWLLGAVDVGDKPASLVGCCDCRCFWLLCDDFAGSRGGNMGCGAGVFGVASGPRLATNRGLAGGDSHLNGILPICDPGQC